MAGIDAAMTELNAAWTAATQDMYNATQQGADQPGGEQPQDGGAAGTKADDNVTDVPYEEVK